MTSIGARLLLKRIGIYPLTKPLTVAAVLRIALMLAAFQLTGTEVMTQGDTASYLMPALSIVHGTFTTGGLPEIDRTPGYPLFLFFSGMWWNNVLLTVLTQIVLSLLSLVLISRIAARIFVMSSATVIAAWLYAIEPVSILSCVRLMPETVFVFLLLCALDGLTAYIRDGKLARLAVAGVFLAAATFTRPVSYYLAFPLSAALPLAGPRGCGRWWKAPAVLLISTLPWLAAWQLRNYTETGYAGFSSIVEKNLYYYQSAEIRAELDHKTLAEEQALLGYPDTASYLSVHPEQAGWTVARRLGFMRAESTRILAQHRLLYLKSHFRGVLIVAFTPCASELLQLLHSYPNQKAMPARILNEGIHSSFMRVLAVSHLVAVTMIAMEIPLLLLYAAALRSLMLPDASKAIVWLLAVVALYFLLISGGAQAVGRYRVPVMPEICILASGGIASVLRNKKAEPYTTVPLS